MQQLVHPNPDIWCAPGWCLMYVRQAFGAPAVEPSATAGWANAKYKHHDYNFPNAWVPLWFTIDTIPEGHVVLRAPDGRIYSTSTPGNTPYIHPNLEHLIWYYGDRVEPQYRLTLRYLGWSEDVSNVRVVSPVPTQPKEDEMNSEQEKLLREVRDRVMGRDTQRYIGPNGEVSTDNQPGYYPARSADIHDVMSTNNWIEHNTNRILAAVSAIPGVDSTIIDKLGEQLSAELAERTANLKLTLAVENAETH